MVEEDGRFVTNPKVVIEVMSESNDDKEMNGKLKSFEKYDSFQEFVIVDSQAKKATAYRKVNGWVKEECKDNRIVFTSLNNYVLTFDDIYFKWNLITNLRPAKINKK